MIKKGDLIKIISMEGAPSYSGRIGTVEYIDDAGQIHGTWGGCAIIPKTDSYRLATADDLNQFISELAKKNYAPYVNEAQKVEVPFVAVKSLSRLERLNGVQPKQYECKVVLDLNGCYESYKQVDAYGHRGRRALICGVPDNMCGQIFDRIKHNIGRDCCPTCLVTPCDLRKNEDDYLPAIDQACELAMNGGVV